MSRGTKLWRKLDMSTKLEIVDIMTDEGLLAREIGDVVGLSRRRVCKLRGMKRKEDEKNDNE